MRGLRGLRTEETGNYRDRFMTDGFDRNRNRLVSVYNKKNKSTDKCYREVMKSAVIGL